MDFLPESIISTILVILALIGIAGMIINAITDKVRRKRNREIRRVLRMELEDIFNEKFKAHGREFIRYDEYFRESFISRLKKDRGFKKALYEQLQKPPETKPEQEPETDPGIMFIAHLFERLIDAMEESDKKEKPDPDFPGEQHGGFDTRGGKE